jgi:hypothetical protein
MIRLEKQPQLAEHIEAWAESHPEGSIEDAIRDLGLWPRPGDKDAQWIVWKRLPQDHPARVSFAGA